MKKILFATDFSDNARQAFDYTIELANQLRVEIVVIQVVKLYPKADMMMSVEKRIIEDNEVQLAQLLEAARTKLYDPAAISGKVVKGEIIKRLKKIAEQLEVDLIVTGTKGERDTEDFYLGRTAGALIKETDTPLLLIPTGHQFKAIQSIAFAIKSPTISTINVVDPLKDFCKVFDAQLHLLKVDPPEEEVQEIIPSKLFLDDLTFSISRQSGTEITATSTAFLQEQPADLFCGIRRQRGFFQKLLTRNGVKKATFNLDIPFLILRGSE